MRRQAGAITDEQEAGGNEVNTEVSREVSTEAAKVVRKALQNYFDALYEGDVKALSQVMHPQARRPKIFRASAARSGGKC